MVRGVVVCVLCCAAVRAYVLHAHTARRTGPSPVHALEQDAKHVGARDVVGAARKAHWVAAGCEDTQGATRGSCGCSSTSSSKSSSSSSQRWRQSAAHHACTTRTHKWRGGRTPARCVGPQLAAARPRTGTPQRWCPFRLARTPLCGVRTGTWCGRRAARLDLPTGTRRLSHTPLSLTVRRAVAPLRRVAVHAVQGAVAASCPEGQQQEQQQQQRQQGGVSSHR